MEVRRWAFTISPTHKQPCLPLNCAKECEHNTQTPRWHLWEFLKKFLSHKFLFSSKRIFGLKAFSPDSCSKNITSVKMKAIKRLSKSPPSPARSNKSCALSPCLSPLLFPSLSLFFFSSFPSVKPPILITAVQLILPLLRLLPLPRWRPSGTCVKG